MKKERTKTIERTLREPYYVCDFCGVELGHDRNVIALNPKPTHNEMYTRPTRTYKADGIEADDECDVCDSCTKKIMSGDVTIPNRFENERRVDESTENDESDFGRPGL